MSQKEIYTILKDLGGKATTEQIRKVAQRKFPDATLSLYVTNRLRKLERKGVVKKEEKSKTWSIQKKFG